MSIEALKKVTLIGQQKHRQGVLSELQTIGTMHLIASQPASEQDMEGETTSTERLSQALHYLMDCPQKRRQVAQPKLFNKTEMVNAVLKNQHDRTALTNQRDKLKQRIQELTPWGNFALPDHAKLAGLRLWFYLVPKYQMAKVIASDLIWQCVHIDHRHHYVVVISEHEPKPSDMPVERCRTGAQALDDLHLALQTLEIELESLDAERMALTRWIYLLQRSMASTIDQATLAQADAQIMSVGELFVIQGWVAVTDYAALEAFALKQHCVVVQQDPDSNDKPPTKLLNPPELAGGEDIVHFFQVPGYHSWDPSRLVFVSFALFFAMIMSDAGYAFIFALIIGLKWRSMQQSEQGRRLSRLGASMAGMSLLWGVLVGSYFGVTPDSSVLLSVKVLDLNDFDSMMRLSICAGALHLILANGMVAWTKRQQLASWASIGWIAVVVGALCTWLFDQQTLFTALAGLGLASIVIFSGQASRSYELKNLISGAMALTQVSKLFGDVLSYLRLFALGLASASLALTFNQLAAQVGASVPGLGLFLQLLILLIGHGLNFVLTVISGVIHGLRLNLIEFYNWSIADEGYAFTPFSKQEVTKWIT